MATSKNQLFSIIAFHIQKFISSSFSLYYIISIHFPLVNKIWRWETKSIQHLYPDWQITVFWAVPFKYVAHIQCFMKNASHNWTYTEYLKEIMHWNLEQPCVHPFQENPLNILICKDKQILVDINNFLKNWYPSEQKEEFKFVHYVGTKLLVGLQWCYMSCLMDNPALVNTTPFLINLRNSCCALPFKHTLPQMMYLPSCSIQYLN